ncbi:hypothetical protein ACFYTQ_26090 [Nocardia sp. NPDC004068]|uniref:hypothetical protein n=1 Tax=Nocardia sp. NPDC004068 TaxID=3364303 RepID=UPI0036785154
MTDDQYNTLLKQMHDGFSTVHGELASMNAEVTAAKTDLAALTSEVASVKDEVAIIKTELAKKANADDIERRFDAVDARFIQLDESIGGIAAEVLNDIAEERAAHDNKVDKELGRHRDWIRQLSSAAQIKLTPDL